MEKKKREEKNLMTSMEKIGEKQNVYHLPEAAPPQIFDMCNLH